MEKTNTKSKNILKSTGKFFADNWYKILVGTILTFSCALLLFVLIFGLINSFRDRYEFMKEVLDAKDRTKAGATISPDGLTLIEVGYEEYKLH